MLVWSYLFLSSSAFVSFLFSLSMSLTLTTVMDTKLLMQEYFKTTYKFLEISPFALIPMHGRVNLWPKHMLCGYLKYVHLVLPLFRWCEMSILHQNIISNQDKNSRTKLPYCHGCLS